MPEYKYLKYRNDLGLLRDLTYRAKVELEFIQADRANNELYNSLIEKHRQLVALAVDVYGAKSNQVQYIKKNTPEKPKSNAKSFQDVMRRYAQWEEDERKRAKGREYYQNRKQKTDAIITQLETRGFALGVDFTRDSALSFALTVLIEDEAS
jgi:hypothetical protein